MIVMRVVRQSKWALLAWFLFALIVTLTILNLVTSPSSLPSKAIYIYMPVSAAVAALIISRQPHHRIGWLMMFTPLVVTLLGPLDTYFRLAINQPGPPGPFLLFAAWLSVWSWWLLMGPIFLILLLFPTGRLPSPGWRWVFIFGGVIFGSFIIGVTLSPTFNVDDPPIQIANPFGVLPASFLNVAFTIITAGVAITALLCVAAVFVRYHHATLTERQQIKWLVFACGIFLVDYSLGFADLRGVNNLQSILFAIVLTGIPIAIGIAILRYHLWDIDVIIRRTLSYTLLTLSLAIIYFGSVILLQRLLGSFFSQGSQVVIVLSTLAIAVLFTPLRRGIQQLIDRRFFRRRYDAEQVLADYATTTRIETDPDLLSDDLVQVIRTALEPDSISLWLKDSQLRQK